MDDQNQTNQPLDAATTPVVPSVPEDITPAEPPVTTTTTTTSSFEPTSPTEVPSIPPVEMPSVPPIETTPLVEPLAPPAEVAPPVSWPVPEPTQTTIPQAETTTTTTTSVATPTPEPTIVPAPEEVPMPTGKPMKKMSPIIGGVVALLLVVGVAGAAYYVSNQLSTRQAVAPNAPESKPAAANKCVELYGVSYDTDKYLDCGTQCCNTDAERCDSIRGCVSLNEDTNPTTNMSVCSVIPNTIYTTGVCAGKATTTSYCPLDCGTQCCDRNSQICCYMTGCQAAGTTCPAIPTGTGLKCPTTVCYNYPTVAAPEDDCNVCSPDRSFLSNVTFATAGSIRIHQEGMIDPGTTVTLTKGTETVTATKVSDGNYDATVTAGTYKVIVKLGFASEGGQAALGFIRPDSSNKCGRYDPTNKRDVSTYSSASSIASFGISTLTGVDIPVQCWADRIQGGDTDQRGQLDANYDFNDFNLIIGYKAVAQEVGACMDIKIYKKVDGVFSATPLITAELQALKVGDVLMVYSRSNIESLMGRFRVTIDGVTSEWVNGTIDGNDKTVHSYLYTIAKAGTYKLEGQVTTKPTN